MIPSRIPLTDRLLDESHEFNFFQAVRLLGLIGSDRPGLGASEHPSDEVVRFVGRQSLQFAASAIHSIDASVEPPRMTISFFGLTGVQGVLPFHYTEHIIARAYAKDFAMADFLDLFNHRLISLFYRAWEKHNWPARYQLAATRGQSDGVTGYLYAFAGLGTEGLAGRHQVTDQALMRYAGLLAQWPRCAVGLQRILIDFFGVPVEVEQFVGAWNTIEEADRCDLTGEGLNNQLGMGAVAGDAVWDPQAGIRLRVGALPLVRFLSFLPDGDAAQPLRELTRFYAGVVPKVEWQPVLEASEVPWCRLGDETAVGPRLGWTAWLKAGEFEQDATDAVFEMAA